MTHPTERRDYSSAIFDASGIVIAMGDDTPCHAERSVRRGIHSPNITLVIPCGSFYATNRREMVQERNLILEFPA